MNPRQYKPFTYTIADIPLIVYPVKDENPLEEVFDNKDKTSIKKHLDNLYARNKALLIGDYHILFVWNLNGNPMTDVWIHNMQNWSDSGPLVDCFTFNGLEKASEPGIASGDSLIALGREEELRRKVKQLEEYVNREKCMPEFPDGLQPTEDFYT